MNRVRIKLRRLLTLTLMLPVLPCFMWGPFMHPYINLRALRKARDRADEGDASINMELVEACEDNLDHFVYGANSADTISTNHVTTGLTIYDYAHNAVPDNAQGLPFFGYALIDQWQRSSSSKPCKADLALACGWLGHQLADWYPHYARMEKGGVLSQDPTGVADEISSFSGFADAHPIFGDDHLPSILRTNTVIEHALIELFYDIIAVHEHDSELFKDPLKCLAMFSDTDDNLHRYVGAFQRIYTRFLRSTPIPNCQFPASHLLMRLLIEVIRVYRPGLVDSLRLRFWQNEFVERSIDRVVDFMFRQDFSEIHKWRPSERYR